MHRRNRSRRALWAVLALAVPLLLLASSMVGVAATGGLGAVLGAAAPAGKPVTPPAADPFNDRIGVTLGANGRFSQGAFPNPANGSPAQNSFTTLYGWPGTGTSYTSLRVDGNDVVFGSEAGTFTQPPTDSAGDETDQSVWASGDISVKQKISVVNNPLTGKEDTAQITYTVTNTGTAAHGVGTRVMFDTDVNGNDGAPFRVPGVGAVTSERDFTGYEVPADFTVFQDLADSAHIAGAVLRGAAATPPDRLVIGTWPGLTGSPWDYTVNPEQPITGDSAYATYWNPASLAAGASRTYTTYYGLGDVTVDLAPPVALGLSGPTSLAADGNRYTPNPFVVTATVSNASATTARNVRLALNLPAGFSTREPTSQVIGDLPVGPGERTFSWTVTADPVGTTTTVPYSVTATTDGAPPKTVTRRLTRPGVTYSGVVVPGTNGPGWGRHGTDFTLSWSYAGAHRYLGNMTQAATNWNNARTHVRFAPWRVPAALHIVVSDVNSRKLTWWGATAYAGDPSAIYTRNYVYLNQATLEGFIGSANDFQRTKVAAHELGHAIGLEHPFDDGWKRSDFESLMWQGPLPYNTPQSHDVDLITQLYR